MNPDLMLQSSSHDPMPHPSGPWDRFLARALASSLDRQLAAGRPPRSGRALAARAREIVSPAGRRELARRWTGVLDLAGHPPVPRTPRGPLCRGAAAVAEPDVREMIAVLAGDLPIAARGTAMASWLLSDGTGPLHNHRSPLDLGAVVREATRQMASLADAPAERADRDSAGCYR